jgi:hypothetical protein
MCLPKTVFGHLDDVQPYGDLKRSADGWIDSDLCQELSQSCCSALHDPISLNVALLRLSIDRAGCKTVPPLKVLSLAIIY